MNINWSLTCNIGSLKQRVNEGNFEGEIENPDKVVWQSKLIINYILAYIEMYAKLSGFESSFWKTSQN